MQRATHSIKWSRIALPGQPEGVYRFELPPGNTKPNRVSFEHREGLELKADWIMRFEMHSPHSDSMYPDITRGDHGFPTISLYNENGSVFMFARGNIKDFFDIAKPNTKQLIELPLGAFLYDIYLQDNPQSEAGFFSSKIVKVTFDFLSHPEEMIDIQLGNLDFLPAKNTSLYDFSEVVEIIGSLDQHELNQSWTVTEQIELRARLFETDKARQLNTKPMYWVLWLDGKPVEKGQIFLKSVYQTLTVHLKEIGQYKLRFRIEANGELVSVSERSVLRVQARSRSVSNNVLGVSDEARYREIDALGGTFERKPIKLQSLQRTEHGGFEFPATDDPFDDLHRSKPERIRSIALFALPRWLSSRPDRADYYRYAPGDWTLYGQVIGWLARRSAEASVDFIEVWNEASVIGHWAGTMEELIKLHEVTRKQITRYAPAIKVLGGCSHTWSFEFLKAFMNAGGGRHCDGLSIHGYTYQPERYVSYFDRIEEIARLNPEPKKGTPLPVHITEIGFRSPAFSEWMQSVYLTIFTLETSSRQTISSIYWFRFFNPREETHGKYNQRASTGYAMIGYKGRYCRPALGAYRWLDNLLTENSQVTTEQKGAQRVFSVVEDGAAKAIIVHCPNGEDSAVFAPPLWKLTDHLGRRRDDDFRSQSPLHCYVPPPRSP